MYWRYSVEALFVILLVTALAVGYVASSILVFWPGRIRSVLDGTSGKKYRVPLNDGTWIMRVKEEERTAAAEMKNRPHIESAKEEYKQSNREPLERDGKVQPAYDFVEVQVFDDPQLRFTEDKMILIRNRAANLQVPNQSSECSMEIIVEYLPIPPHVGRGINEILESKQREGAGLGKQLCDALNEYIAQKVTGACWEKLDSNRIDVDQNDIDSAAQAIDNLRADAHHVIVGEPSEAVMKAAGIPSSVSEVASEVLAEIPLPIDRPLMVAERSICVSEIIVGMTPGLHHLAMDGIRRLTHEFAVSALEKGLGKLEELVIEEHSRHDVPENGPELWPEELRRIDEDLAISAWDRADLESRYHEIERPDEKLDKEPDITPHIGGPWDGI
jgi:hypothetical protein